MELPGRGEWFRKQKRGAPFSPEFHPNPDMKGDPAVEDLLRRHHSDQEGAVTELEEKLQKNPEDVEARRQLNLIHNRLRELLDRVSGIVGH